MRILGYDLYSPLDKRCFSALDSSCHFSELLMEPLQLARGDELFDQKFVNLLHVLQVLLQFLLHLNTYNVEMKKKKQLKNVVV